MRLIDAHLAQKIADEDLRDDEYTGAVQYVLSHTPTIDAVPVVRCKDCKAWTCFMNNPDGTMFGNCELCGNNFRNEDDYCSYGKRKESDDGKTDN